MKIRDKCQTIFINIFHLLNFAGGLSRNSLSRGVYCENLQFFVIELPYLINSLL